MSYSVPPAFTIAVLTLLLATGQAAFAIALTTPGPPLTANDIMLVKRKAIAGDVSAEIQLGKCPYPVPVGGRGKCLMMSGNPASSFYF